MDPIELLIACRQGALNAHFGLNMPRLFTAGEIEDLWRREPARVRAILDEILCAPGAHIGLELLLKSGVIDALFPEIAEMKALADDPASSLHKDVWEHTKQVVMGVPAKVELRWGALMHDIGKARTRAFDGRKVTFHKHEVVGAKMLESIQRRMKLFDSDPALFRTVKALVFNHLRPATYKSDWTDSGVRRLVADLGGMANFRRLMALSRADLTTKNPNKRARATANGDELERRVAIVFEADNAPRLPKGVMGAIIVASKLSPGAWCNTLRDTMESMMATGSLSINGDVDYYVAQGISLLAQADPRLKGPSDEG